ncbi:MAG: redoxin domain-containing protein [Flavobacteriales bacterium]|nr:redoxin domain-containing protein [Flavobacteriales bacterium]
MRVLFFISLVFLVACASKPKVQEVVLTSLSQEQTSIKPSQNALTVIYFLSPECPLCINYTLVMGELNEHFASDSLKFYGVFSNEWYSPEEVRMFQLKYNLGFDMLFDTENRLAQALSATVTPEVFVLNSASEVLYSGKIDNWVNELGKKKLEVTDHYLRNALLAWRNGKPIHPMHTQPIGCLIE